MKRLPGSLFFVAAAVYLVTQGEMDLLTLPAVLGCAVAAVLALGRGHIWALLTGVGLISVSLGLQLSLNYRCSFCLKTDLLILAAVVSLALIQEGRQKLPAWIIAGIISLLLLGVTTTAAPPPQTATETEALLLAQEKPALLFNPDCEACGEVVGAVIGLDPVGANWLAVQSGGQRLEGRQYLEDKGYRGPEALYQQTSYAVPALLTEVEGEIKLIRDKEEILRLIAGGVEG